MNGTQKMFIVLLAMFAFSMFVVAENFQYKNTIKEKDGIIQKLTTQKANCTDLGICIGDVVVPTDDAMKYLNQTFMREIQYGAKVKRVDTKTNVITIDKGNENYDYLADVWVRKVRSMNIEVGIEVVGSQQSYCDESGCSEVLGSYRSFQDSDKQFQYEYDISPTHHEIYKKRMGEFYYSMYSNESNMTRD